MIFKILFYITTSIALSTTVSATNTCNVKDITYDNCNYTVECDVYPGSAYVPDCNHDFFITFVITNSNVETVTTAFFGSTNFDSRVRVIKAIRNRWNTIDAFSFRYYSRSIELDLSSNNIQNIKNDAFRNLGALKSLNISHNNIITLNQKTFQISESKNSVVEILDLSYNYLSNLFGDIFNSLPNLTKLYLNNNNIDTIGEDTFTNNKQLIHLYLQHNFINSLNMTLINMKLLQELDVSNNVITKLSGYQINRLNCLEIFNMSYNSLNNVDTDCFKEASNLKIVDLKYNKIDTVIDDTMFANNKKLTYLDISQNNVSQIQDNAFKYNTLNYLNLENNNITGNITETTFCGLVNIQSLTLFNQSITNIKNRAFSNLTNLFYLNMSHNFISVIENSSFTDVNPIRILDLSFNRLSCIHFLQNSLPNLTDLYLNNNVINKILKNVFDNKNQLKRLVLSGNQIIIVEQFSLPLTNLQYLNIYNNPISGVLKNNVFSPAKLLRYLDLSEFNLSKIDENAITNLPGVARVNISHNKIESIDPNNFVGMDNMYSLDVSYNQLSCLHLNNTNLNNLKALYLNNNKLQNISTTLLNITSLLYLDVSFNELTDLATVNFSLCPNLTTLYMSHNKIVNFNNPSTNSLTNLVDLQLSSNSILSINLSYFKNLLYVELCNNSIANINSSFFKNLEYLQYMNLSFNNITELIPGTFQNLKILTRLDISHNHISNLRYGTFRGLHRTNFLDLSYNEIAFQEVDVFHECTELTRLIFDYNNLKTLDVERLLVAVPTLKTLSIGGNPISCKEIVHNVRTVNMREVEVTSIDKVFHEDNVHGIKCGDDEASTTAISPHHDGNRSDSPASSAGMIAWCTILTVLVVALAVAYLYYNKRKHTSRFRDRTIPSTSSLDLEGSEMHGNLLG